MTRGLYGTPIVVPRQQIAFVDQSALVHSLKTGNTDKISPKLSREKVNYCNL